MHSQLICFARMYHLHFILFFASYLQHSSWITSMLLPFQLFILLSTFYGSFFPRKHNDSLILTAILVQISTWACHCCLKLLATECVIVILMAARGILGFPSKFGNNLCSFNHRRSKSWLKVQVSPLESVWEPEHLLSCPAPHEAHHSVWLNSSNIFVLGFILNLDIDYTGDWIFQ